MALSMRADRSHMDVVSPVTREYTLTDPDLLGWFEKGWSPVMKAIDQSKEIAGILSTYGAMISVKIALRDPDIYRHGYLASRPISDGTRRG